MTIAELPLADTLARPLRDLRISVTDRCQFRCTSWMPREVFGRDFAFLPRQELLTFEELSRVTRVFTGLGVRKLRLTGGEPLLRRDLEKLVAMLAAVVAEAAVDERDSVDADCLVSGGELPGAVGRRCRVVWLLFGGGHDTPALRPAARHPAWTGCRGAGLMSLGGAED